MPISNSMMRLAKVWQSRSIATGLVIGLSLFGVADLMHCYQVSDAARSVGITAMSAHAEDRSIADAAEIADKSGSLFGVRVVMPAAEPAHPVPASVAIQTPFPRLALSGILSGANAMAVILDGSSQEQVYRPGDLLPGGARLEAVMENAIRVSFSGTSRIVRLEWEGGSRMGTDVLPAAVPYDQATPPTADPAADTTQ